MLMAITGPLAILHSAAAEPPADQVLSFVPLPQEGLQSLAGGDRELNLIAEGLQAAAVAQQEGKDVRRFGGVPFLATSNLAAQVLASNRVEVVIPIAQNVATFCLLFAVLDPGKEMQAHCMIAREDGIAIWLRYDSRINVGPSIGKWDGAPKPAEEKPGKTEAVGAITAKDGTPVRLFCTTWVNDNWWYPVNKLKWKVLDPGARVVILGVTVGNPKK